jgi:hypothetical protein
MISPPAADAIMSIPAITITAVATTITMKAAGAARKENLICFFFSFWNLFRLLDLLAGLILFSRLSATLKLVRFKDFFAGFMCPLK